jgi:hypothetical protein
MKMVKKILFTIAVVAFLTASVQAVDPGKYQQKFDGQWPFEYIFVEVCSIPILIDVGYFVQLEKCGDYKIKLKQVPCGDIGKSTTGDFPCYEDCEDIKVRANFEVKMGGEVDESISPSWWKDGDNKVVYGDCGQGCSPDIVPGDGAWHTRKVCVRAWDIKIWNAAGAQGQNEYHVADLLITVKPTQEPWWEGQ